jgi:hypothetical protein
MRSSLIVAALLSIGFTACAGSALANGQNHNQGSRNAYNPLMPFNPLNDGPLGPRGTRPLDEYVGSAAMPGPADCIHAEGQIYCR